TPRCMPRRKPTPSWCRKASRSARPTSASRRATGAERPPAVQPQSDTGPGPQRGLVEYAHWIYGLHALAVVVALLGARSVAVRFAFSLPSIVAVLMNYARRAEARGTWLES